MDDSVLSDHTEGHVPKDVAISTRPRGADPLRPVVDLGAHPFENATSDPADVHGAAAQHGAGQPASGFSIPAPDVAPTGHPLPGEREAGGAILRLRTALAGIELAFEEMASPPSGGC